MAIKDDKLRDVGLLVLRMGIAVPVLFFCMAILLAGFSRSHSYYIFPTNPGYAGLVGKTIVLVDFVGAIGVVLGLFTRLGGFFLVCTLLATLYDAMTFHARLQWPVSVGYLPEPPLLIFEMIVLAAGLMFVGAGGMSLDAKIFKRGKR